MVSSVLSSFRSASVAGDGVRRRDVGLPVQPLDALSVYDTPSLRIALKFGLCPVLGHPRESTGTLSIIVNSEHTFGLSS